MLEDPRLSMNNVRVPRRDNYEKRPVLSATIHPDLKKILVSMSERTGLSISQITDEVLYAGLIEMQEMDELEELVGEVLYIGHRWEQTDTAHMILKVVMPRCFLRWRHQSDTLLIISQLILHS